MREADERVVRALVEPDVVIFAGAHARDLEVAALDQAERVVELDRSVAACAAGAAP